MTQTHINHENVQRFLAWSRSRIRANDQLSPEIRSGMADAHRLAEHTGRIKDPGELPSLLHSLGNLMAEHDTETGVEHNSPTWDALRASLGRLAGESTAPSPSASLQRLLRATAAFIDGEPGSSDALTLAMFDAEKSLGGHV